MIVWAGGGGGVLPRLGHAWRIRDVPSVTTVRTESARCSGWLAAKKAGSTALHGRHPSGAGDPATARTSPPDVEITVGVTRRQAQLATISD